MERFSFSTKGSGFLKTTESLAKSSNETVYKKTVGKLTFFEFVCSLTLKHPYSDALFLYSINSTLNS